MKLFITFIVLMLIALCYWIYSGDSYYWRIKRTRNLEICIISICLIIAIISFLFVWLN